MQSRPAFLRSTRIVLVVALWVRACRLMRTRNGACRGGVHIKRSRLCLRSCLDTNRGRRFTSRTRPTGHPVGRRPINIPLSRYRPATASLPSLLYRVCRPLSTPALTSCPPSPSFPSLGVDSKSVYGHGRAQGDPKGYSGQIRGFFGHFGSSGF